MPLDLKSKRSWVHLNVFLFNTIIKEIDIIIGFDRQDKILFDEDVYVKRETILNSLINYEFEYASEIDYFLQSASNNFGFFSFKKLEQKLIHKELEKTICKFIDSSFHRDAKDRYEDGDLEYESEEDEVR